MPTKTITDENPIARKAGRLSIVGGCVGGLDGGCVEIFDGLIVRFSDGCLVDVGIGDSDVLRGIVGAVVSVGSRDGEGSRDGV
mmetsp:Transcript_5839/g.8962  ORF Transcript_5839/g.8962 Transcript_5839/m.8962 type:complete len:83 (+) Transcript_5839:292-540(+)